MSFGTTINEESDQVNSIPWAFGSNWAIDGNDITLSMWSGDIFSKSVCIGMSTIPSNPTAIHPVTVQISMEVGITLFLWDFFCDFDVSVMLTMEMWKKIIEGKLFPFTSFIYVLNYSCSEGKNIYPLGKKEWFAWGGLYLALSIVTWKHYLIFLEKLNVNFRAYV